MHYPRFWKLSFNTRFPEKNLIMAAISATSADRPGFGRDLGRKDPWLFPGAKDFQE